MLSDDLLKDSELTQEDADLDHRMKIVIFLSPFKMYTRCAFIH